MTINMTSVKLVNIILSMAAADTTPDKIAVFIDALADNAALSANISAAAPAPAPAPKSARKTTTFVVLPDNTIAPADAADFDTTAFRTR